MNSASINKAKGTVILANGESISATDIKSVRVGQKPNARMLLGGGGLFALGLVVHFMAGDTASSYAKLGIVLRDSTDIGQAVAICMYFFSTLLTIGGVLAGKHGLFIATSSGLRFADFESKGDAEQAMKVITATKHQIPSSANVDDLTKLFALKQSGAISEAEFETLKQKILGRVA